MEELLSHVEKQFRKIDDLEHKWNEDFEQMKIKVDAIVTGSNMCQTPQQNKKKTKRLSIIYDSDNTKQPEGIIKLEPQNVEDTSRRASRRPVRAAKLKVESMKLPTIKGKLRRPFSSADTSSMLSVNKTLSKQDSNEDKINDESKLLERMSTRSKTSVSSEIPPTGQRNSNENKRKESSSTVDRTSEPSKKIDDESLLIVPNGDEPILIVSDDESEKMPPPAAVPKRKKKAKLSESDLPLRTLRLRIKHEKKSLENGATKEDTTENSNALEKKDKSIVEAPPINVKQEKIDKSKTSSSDDKSTGSKKGKRGRKALKHKPIKEEKKDSIEKSKETEIADNVSEKEQIRNPSLESVYEDAVGKLSTNVPKMSITKIQPVVMIEKLKTPIVTDTVPQQSPDKAIDATFVSAKDVVTEVDTTFTATTSHQQTFVMDKKDKPEKELDTTKIITTDLALDATRTVTPNTETNNGDATFCVNNMEPNQELNQTKDILRSSIMTEEDSINEWMPPPPVPTASLLTKAKSKNELFNPFIQSPVKKKVEAFEKHTTAIAKMVAKENKDPETPNGLSLHKSITPLIGRLPSKLLTPSQYQNITPNLIGSKSNKLQNSNSKISYLQKTNSSSSVTSKTQSLSRDNSAEDLKRGSTKQQLEEKKRKREQKQQQAAIAREAKEKERAEKVKKAIREREEKMRRKAMEAEQKKQLDDVNRNLKLQEEKREAQKRMEKQKQLEQEMSEAKIQKAKEELHLKLLENQKLQQQKKLKKTLGKSTSSYNFDMLNSDDSTDDEGKVNTKRPTPPMWSKSSNRQLLLEQQSHLSTKVIDNFFSVEPMTPDLREIFPAIDPRYLKRNSSMFWNTPPRYSQLPKY